MGKRYNNCIFFQNEWLRRTSDDLTSLVITNVHSAVQGETPILWLTVSQRTVLCLNFGICTSARPTFLYLYHFSPYCSDIIFSLQPFILWICCSHLCFSFLGKMEFSLSLRDSYYWWIYQWSLQPQIWLQKNDILIAVSSSYLNIQDRKLLKTKPLFEHLQ